ncbi:MAG: (Fe-S)-binding protein, partial [Nocardioidaceae bacterium]
EGQLTPVAPVEGSVAGNGASPTRTITYHDPCFIGRHNQVYEPPRELLSVIPGAELKEMARTGERSFCCSAGGARMWMEEEIGERINLNRTSEAVATGADQIAVACPFCRVMLSDGLTALQADGSAREEVEVLDVAQLLLASVRRTPAAPGDPAAVEAESAETETETDPLDAVTPPNADLHDPGDADTAARLSGPTPSPDEIAFPEKL